MNENRIIALFVYLTFVAVLQSAVHDIVNHDQRNLVKIECFVHADNADVHKLCIDHGYVGAGSGPTNGNGK